MAWTTSDFFVLRTPYLPLDCLLALSDGLEAAEHRGDPAALESALYRDRVRVRDRLRLLYRRPDVREALFIASPALEERLDDWERDPESQRGQRVERSLLRYVARMAGRPTPFGLFAGYSVGRVTGARTRLRLPPQRAYRRHTRLDHGYISAVSEALQRNPSVRQRLTYFPNSSLYEVAGRFRYAEARHVGKGRSYHLVVVEPTSYLRDVLERAAAGARLGELADALCSADPEIVSAEAQRFVGALVDHQILVPELRPTVSGAEPMLELLDRLSAISDDPAVSGVTTALSVARDALAALDEKPPGVEPARYRHAAAALGAVPNTVDRSRLFHVDLLKPAATATLGGDVISEIVHGVNLLHRLGSGRGHDPLRRFREAFQQRYGDREVPLCEALDEEAGIGFHAWNAPSAAAAPLLDGLVFPSVEQPESRDGAARHRLLLRWLCETLRTGAEEIRLGPYELECLEKADGPATAALPLPDAFSVVATILAGSEEAVAEGRYRVHLSSAGGPSGANLLGRFCQSDETLTRHVRAHLRAEEALRPDVTFAEIVHLPQDRAGNVLSRPLLRGYEIPYLGGSGAPRDRQIPVGDLWISIAGNRVVLRSKSLGREIIPRLTTAHNFGGTGNLGVYRFLCALQRQGLARGLNFSFGALEHAPYLPRVTAGRLVLARARWNLNRAQLEPLGQLCGSARFAAMQALRERLRLPRWVAIMDGDNLLPIDLDNVLLVDVAAHLLKNRSGASLVELFYGPDDVFTLGPEGRFTHELVVPFVRVNEPSMASPMPRRAARPTTQKYPPGSEWLYAKLYTGAAGADVVLAEIVRPVVQAALSRGAADGWFFVRHGDPDWHIRLRLHGDRRRLLNQVLPVLLDSCAPLLTSGLLWRLQLDTYEPEVERYGGPFGVVTAERLFRADSDAALDVLEAVQGDEGAEARWRLALIGIDRLLSDLGMRDASKRAIVGAARDRFGEELQVDLTLRRQLGDRYRRERAGLESLLGPTARVDPSHPLAAGLTAYAARSRALRPIVAELRAGARSGHLTKPLTALAGSYIHMHANRILRSATRAQELVLYDFLCRLYESETARRPAGAQSLSGHDDRA